MVANKPTQLERIRKEKQDKLYARQPQLMKRLIPFIRKAEIIESETEPYLHSPKDHLKNRLIKPNKNYNKKKLRKELNKFDSKMKKNKKFNVNKITKISEIQPKVLWGLK